MSSNEIEPFTFIDLFAGVGGFHHALGGIGGKCVLAVERDRAARAVYQAAFPNTRIEPDVRDLTTDQDGRELPVSVIRRNVPPHDVLCAGFPCQPFSKSGFQLGVRDKTRGTLFYDIMSIVLARKPKYVLLENVRNLAGPRHVETFRDIVESLESAGYSVPSDPILISPHLLSPAHGGAPQARDRVFIVAVRSRDFADRFTRLVAPDPAWNPAAWSLESVLEPNLTSDERKAYALRPEEIGWFDCWQSFVKSIRADSLPSFPIWVDEFENDLRFGDEIPGWKRAIISKNVEFYKANAAQIDQWRKRRFGANRQRVADFPASRRKFEWQARSAQPTRHSRDLTKLVLHFRPSGIRVKPATYLPALVAMNQTSVLGSQLRRIAPIEAARLQGIPFEPFAKAGVADSVVYRQLGNAVNVGVVRHVAEAMFAAAPRRSSGRAAPI